MGKWTISYRAGGKMLLNILMSSYIFFVVMDSALTYIGIKHFGLVEIWPSKVLFQYYGLSLGLIVSTAFCFFIGWLLWKIRRFKFATYSAVSVLAVTAFAAVVNNTIAIIEA